jgi:hypothetical protein
MTSFFYFDGVHSSTPNNNDACDDELDTFYNNMTLYLSLVIIVCLVVMCIVMIINIIRTKLNIKKLKETRSQSPESDEFPCTYQETPIHAINVARDLGDFDDGSNDEIASFKNNPLYGRVVVNPRSNVAICEPHYATAKHPQVVVDPIYDVVKQPKKI